MTSMASTPDLILGRYRELLPIAKGGQGFIHLGRVEGSAGFAKPVVIKRILPGTDSVDVVQQFTREAMILSQMKHPGIVNILDFGRHDNGYVMVLDYVHGHHLGHWARFVRKARGPFPVEFAVHALIAVLDALHYAHNLRGSDGESLNIVHRDVSPANVLIDTEGHVFLTDFGIARIANDITDASSVATVKGKFAYVAPEHWNGAPPSVGTDVFAAGVMLHVLLRGGNEFQADTMEQTVMKVLSQDLSSLAARRPDVPRDIDEIIRAAVTKDPVERRRQIPHAKAFADRLRQILGVPAHLVGERFAAAVSEDFLNPEMAVTVGMPPLETRERAWQGPRLRSSRPPPPIIPVDVEELDGGEVPAVPAATDAGEPRLEPSGPGRPRGSVWAVAVVAMTMIVAAAGIGVTWLLTRDRGSDVGQAPVVMVQGDVQADNVPAVATPPGVPAVAAGDQGEAPEPTVDPAATPPIATDLATPRPSSAASMGPPRQATDTPRTSLNRTFAGRRQAMTRCFADHATAIEGSPQIAVELDVELDGTVSRAVVVPQTLRQTPLGACIESVAGATSFGRQAEPISIRFPIHARRVD